MKKLKIKKLICWLIDFWLYFGVVMMILTLSLSSLYSIVLESPDIVQIVFGMLPLVIIYLSYSKKDVLFKGRSLGKRILSLAIYNEEGTELVDSKVLKKRGNIELFTFPLDFWFILFLEKQIADYVCKTEVRDYKEG